MYDGFTFEWFIEPQSGEYTVPIIGAGRVQSTLGRRWAGCGHEIVYGVRNPEDSKHQALTDHAQVVSSPEAAQAGEIVVLSVHWGAAQAAVDSIKAGLRERFGGLYQSCGRKPGGSSAAEQIQARAPKSTVVKSFNQIGSNIMADPVLDGRKTILFVASDLADACAAVEGLATELDFEVVAMPSLSYARQLEAFAKDVDFRDVVQAWLWPRVCFFDD